MGDLLKRSEQLSVNVIVYNKNKRYLYSSDNIEWRNVLCDEKGTCEFEYALSGNIKLNKIGDNIGDLLFSISIVPTPKSFLSEDLVLSSIDLFKKESEDNDINVYNII